MMLWVVRHKWPSGVRFMFKIYRHQSILVVRGESNKTTIFLLSSEGATQGYPLAMAGYDILSLSLIIQLTSEFPKVKPPWYTYDGSAAGTLKQIFFFKRLCEICPDCGYFPEESQSILIIMSKDNKKVEFFRKKNN